MIAQIARVVSSTVRKPAEDGDTLKILGIFCGAGLLLSLLVAMAFALDLTPL
ncbi:MULTISPECIES: hypothetical protein [Bradyrhizobium]|uniref:Uncharacterized protein n=1 Tax=Bradyrhizobium zhengyangense TaxID=2911009 RepID=A0A9X1R909_9BRAD|nr:MULTISPECIES: hypothetical protein [Bradyrhizobium]MCG2628086.1 hypothetical protein [Bradyrhizobium zhengyangense]MCG2643205.1 hypothetical protein [Bradyrhizobium zhengyangense]MCG2670481.1 hypothetical protein [Bradyrhizobium zhengyangense]MDN4985784.1 hypothetical protein [Bradyrhizobium sp. WYCCWR 13022]MDT4736625.1 hypothetical protein [Bradyrhizobium sp. WYCCWR 12699]